MADPTDLLKNTPLPSEPCAEGATWTWGLYCDHGVLKGHFVLDEAGGGTLAVKSPCGGLSSAALTAIHAGWPKADVFELIDKLKSK